MHTQPKTANKVLLAFLLTAGCWGQVRAGWVEELCADHKWPAMCIARINAKLGTADQTPVESGWSYARRPGMNFREDPAKTIPVPAVGANNVPKHTIEMQDIFKERPDQKARSGNGPTDASTKK